MDLGLRDKVIIVTGGGAGIGAGISRACLDEGARVVILSRRSENVQEFMDTLVERTVGILEHEPIDVYANPTFLPQSIAGDWDSLWTEERLRKVVGAAAANGIAIELNNRYRLPGERAVRLAKELKCKFTYGSNNTSPTDLRRCEYGLEMTEKCGLKWQDFWVPGAFGTRAIERKGAVLRG